MRASCYCITSLLTVLKGSQTQTSDTEAMAQVINLAGPIVKIVDSPISELTMTQVLIEEVLFGSIPKD